MTSTRAGHLPAAAKRFLMWDTEPAAFGITMPFPVPNSMDADTARAMITALVDNHETLRGRYTYGPDARWEIFPSADSDESRPELRTLDISAVDDADLGALIERETAAANQRLDPASGRVVTATLCTRPAHGNLLLLTVHHVACDAVALWILWGDMTTYVRQWESGEPIALEPERTTASEWAEFLEKYSETRTGELDYWLATSDSEPSEPVRAHPPEPVYLDGVIEDPLAERIFEELPAAFGATYTRILLVAFGLAIEDVLGVPRPIQVQKHGRYARLRPGADLGRTIGWLSDDYPWLLSPTVGSTAARIRHANAEYPATPEDFTLLRWYNGATSRHFHTFRNPKFYFNFVGELGGYVPASRSRDMARLTTFDLSVLLGGYRSDGVRRVHYSVHAPTGGLGAERAEQIVAQWRSILGTVDTSVESVHGADSE
ncbi:hypothetical protein JMUB6875_59430 [Nocardia sp. JMUB6875]|uniref:condensation domain-containing protein n=1 Tax=Nocardia sp. JMUB6875 TaxID=3158170 RepID=UPI0032E6F3FE